MKYFLELLPIRMRNKLCEHKLVRNALNNDEIFRCRALAGDSNYNICINSDMTVSCNCQDYDGFGRLGSLDESSLEQIFSGPVATKFRTLLAERKFPIPTCINCAELEVIPSSKVNSALTDYHVPQKGIMVENTAHCNYRCRICAGRQKLLDLRSVRDCISLENVDKIANILKEKQIENLYYFNLGEPFLPESIHEQIAIIRRNNPNIRIITSTNGQLLNTDQKINAALMMDYIYISLDGVDQKTVGRYQVGAKFDTVYKNIVRLVEARNNLRREVPIIEWKYVVFRWNDHPEHIRTAVKLARDAQADVIGFYRGVARRVDMSLRWDYHSCFAELGRKQNDGIVVNLNNIPNNLLSP